MCPRSSTPIAANRRSLAQRRVRRRSQRCEHDRNPIAGWPMRHRIIHDAIQPSRRDACGRKKAPRPTLAHVTNLQPPSAIADGKQPGKANALHHQHHGAPAHAPDALAVMIPRNEVSARAALRFGRVSRLGVGMLNTDNAMRAWSCQASQNMRRRQCIDHDLPLGEYALAGQASRAARWIITGTFDLPRDCLSGRRCSGHAADRKGIRRVSVAPLRSVAGKPMIDQICFQTGKSGCSSVLRPYCWPLCKSQRDRAAKSPRRM